jgi:hypothetical protein
LRCIICKVRWGPVAQWLEQQTHNLLVVGSSPTGPTKPFVRDLTERNSQCPHGKQKGEINLALKRVKPGDLVTAEFLNQMIDEINRLSKAVATLERKRVAKAVVRKRPTR